MVTEKEFNIIKALVEEETGCLREADYLSSKILTNYLFTLSNIVEKLERDVSKRRNPAKRNSVALS